MPLSGRRWHDDGRNIPIMKLIELTKGKVAKVDDEDFEWLSARSWCVDSGGYAKSGKGRMHRVIMDPPKGMCVDHANRDKLDNRRSNLRIVTYGQNVLNAKIRSDNKSGVRGVFWSKQAHKWSAQIGRDGKQHHLGFFTEKCQAVAAYQDAAKEHPNANFFNLSKKT